MSDASTKSVGLRIAAWHRWLTGKAAAGPDAGEGSGDGQANIGALSDLRRCADGRDAMLTLAFGRLVATVHPAAATAGTSELSPEEIAALGRTALIMSRVERCGSGPPHAGYIPRMMAATAQGRAAPAVGPVRAAVLFAAPDADEACRCLLSLLPLLEDAILDPGRVYAAMRWWDSEKRRWAMDYHVMTAASAAA